MYSNELVIKILEYINNNINKKITMDELSKTFYFNKDYLMRLFKKELNTTIMEYINKQRIYNSLETIKSENNSIIKIALNNGFYSQEYFTETFTKIIGVSPLIYRKFTKANNQITEKEYDDIRKNLTSLNTLLKNIELYKKNTPTTEVKKLTLFK